MSRPPRAILLVLVVLGCAHTASQSPANVDDSDDPDSLPIIDATERTLTVAIVGEARAPRSLGECVDATFAAENRPCIGALVPLDNHPTKQLGVITREKQQLFNQGLEAKGAVQLARVAARGSSAKAAFLVQWRRSYDVEIPLPPDDQVQGQYVSAVWYGAAAYLTILVKAESQALEAGASLTLAQIKALLSRSQAQVFLHCSTRGGRDVCAEAKLGSGRSVTSAEELTGSVERFREATARWSLDIDKQPAADYPVVAYTIRTPQAVEADTDAEPEPELPAP
jgi:hypothetical protein